MPKCSPRSRYRNPPEQDEHPEEEAEGQKDLPETAQIQVFEPLAAEPGPQVAHPAVNADELADQAPKNDDRQRGQQPVGKPVLTPRLTSGDEGRQKDAGRKKTGGHPKDGELQVPGARDVKRQQAGKVNAEEAGQVGPIMLGRPAQQGLEQEKHDHDPEKPRTAPLCGR